MTGKEEIKKLLVLKLDNFNLAELTYFLKSLLKTDVVNTGGVDYYHGSSLESFLTEEGILDEVEVKAEEIVKDFKAKTTVKGFKHSYETIKTSLLHLLPHSSGTPVTIYLLLESGD